MKTETGAALSAAFPKPKPKSELLSFSQIEKDYGSPKESTMYAWVCLNRYGIRDLVIKVGRLSRIRRSDFEDWLASRQAGGKAA